MVLPRIAALSARRLDATLHAVDSQSNVSTRHAVDRFQAIVMEETHWTGSLLDYCLANKIRLVIPARHSDLGPLAEAQSEFKENGVHIAISSEATISICTNKLKTYEFLENHGFPTPFRSPWTPILSKLPKNICLSLPSPLADRPVLESMSSIDSISCRT